MLKLRCCSALSDGDRDVGFTPWADPNIQNACCRIPAGFNLPTRMYMPEAENAGETSFTNGQQNTTYTDRVSAALPKILGAGGIFSYSLGGDTTDPATFAAAAVATHKRFLANGIKVPMYECFNEPDGRIDVQTLANVLNATAQALHAIDPTILVGGPVYSFFQAGDYKTYASLTGSNLGFMPYVTLTPLIAAKTA